MEKKVEPLHGAKEPQPVLAPFGIITLTVNDQSYEILRYPRHEGTTTSWNRLEQSGSDLSRGPDLEESIEMANNRVGRKMLTRKEADEIGDSSQEEPCEPSGHEHLEALEKTQRDQLNVNDAFKHALRPGEWSYVLDEKLEEGSQAAFFYHDEDGGLYTDVSRWPHDSAPTLVLKVVDSKTLQQSPYIILRVFNREQ